MGLSGRSGHGRRSLDEAPLRRKVIDEGPQLMRRAREVVLVCVAGLLFATACSSDRAQDETSTPSSTSQSATTSQPAVKTSTTEPPPSPQKTPPGGIGGTG